MIVRLAPATAAHVAVALRRHVRQLRRDGVTPPAALVELADALLSGQERTKLACWCGGGNDQTAPGLPAVVSAGAAADLLQISCRSLRRFAATGRIAQVRIGRRVFYRTVDLEAFMAAARTMRRAS